MRRGDLIPLCGAALLGILTGQVAFQSHRAALSLPKPRSAAMNDAFGLAETPADPTAARLEDELKARFAVLTAEPGTPNLILFKEAMDADLRRSETACVRTLKAGQADALLKFLLIRHSPWNALHLANYDAMRTLARESSDVMSAEILRRSFEELINQDPARAFRSLGDLPEHLRDRAARDLACKWGEKAGRPAAEAFKVAQQWIIQFNDALYGWSKSDPTAAMTYLLDLEVGDDADKRSMIDTLLWTVGEMYPEKALEMGKLAALDGNARGQNLFVLARTDPQAALRSIEATSDPTARRRDLLSVVGGMSESNEPALALKLVAELPVSMWSLKAVQRAVAEIAKKDPEGARRAAETQTNEYVREAAMKGLTMGAPR